MNEPKHIYTNKNEPGPSAVMECVFCLLCGHVLPAILCRSCCFAPRVSSFYSQSVPSVPSRHPRPGASENLLKNDMAWPTRCARHGRLDGLSVLWCPFVPNSWLLEKVPVCPCLFLICTFGWLPLTITTRTRSLNVGCSVVLKSQGSSRNSRRSIRRVSPSKALCQSPKSPTAWARIAGSVTNPHELKDMFGLCIPKQNA